MAPTDRTLGPLHAAIAAELRQVSAQLEALAETLVGDEHFVETYMEALQSFDLLVQCSDENARVLDRLASGSAPDAAIAPVRLGVMQARLTAALAQAA
ncbi:MAG TPA: hypothetical protein VFQ57_02955 [Sphingomonas sp.]|jgi:hypothetical protein|nr:hypothetical protein [Sphingomonas sp.]